MKPYIIHGQLQDVIDYSVLIKFQSMALNTPVRVKHSKRSVYSNQLSGSKSNIKRLNLKMLKK